MAGYLLIWASTVQGKGGPEGYVRDTDFVSTLTGAQIIRDGNGQELYDPNMQRAAQNRVLSPYKTLTDNNILPYNHLPFEAILVAPLTETRYWFAFAAWTLAAGLAMGVAVGILDAALPVSRVAGWVLSLAACSYLPVIRSLMLGQNSAFVLMGLCATYLSLKRNREGWAGAAMLLVALKPQVLPVVLLVLVLGRHRRALAVFFSLFAALCVGAMFVLGPGWPVQYVALLLSVAGGQDSGAISPAIMHNWRGLATQLLGGWAPGLVTPVFLLLSAASVAMLAWAWVRSRRHATGHIEEADLFVQHYRPSTDLLWALAGIVAVLTSYHLNPHDLTLLIFPAWIIGAYAVSGVWGRAWSRLWYGMLWAGYLLAPLTLYSENSALAVVPSVLLMALAACLLALQLGVEGTPTEPNVGVSLSSG